MEKIFDLFRQIPIKEIGKYVTIKETMLRAIQIEGVHTLFDFWNKDFDEVTTKGFHKKRVKDIQKEFKSLSYEDLEEGLEDFLFWEKERVLPTAYDANRPIEENLQLVLEELIEYIDGCVSRETQICGNNDKNRVKNLQTVLRGRYVEHLERNIVAGRIGKTEERAIRQLLFLELLNPLFEGATLKYKVLNHLSINTDLVQKVQEFRKTMMFKGYDLTENCSVEFFEDVLNIDFLTYAPLSYIVPHREKLCYKHVLQAFIDELTAVMRGTPAEEIEDIIDQHPKVQDEVYGNNKTYDEAFIYQLLYDDKLIQDTDTGKLIKPEYIRNFGQDELGDIHQERALARVIADQNRPVTREEIIGIYNQRYGENLLITHNLAPTVKYGCRSIGRTHWEYSQDTTNLKDWIADYTSNIGRPFTFDEVKESLNREEIVYNSETTVRTYITKHCAVHCKQRDRFCHRDIISQQPEFNQWRRRIRSGIFNWLVNEIHLLFQEREVDQLNCNEIADHILHRAQTIYDFDRNTILNYCYCGLPTSDNGPFRIESTGRGQWSLCKSNNYDTTDWLNYGLKGRVYQRKMINQATHIVRHTKHNQMLLSDLVRSIQEEIGDDIYEDNNEPLSERKIRQKLIEFIERNEVNHPLQLRKDREGRLLVVLDARRINEEKRYESTNRNTDIQYRTISSLNEINWDEFKSLLVSELAFCQQWIDEDCLGVDYNEAVEEFVSFIKEDYNNNLRTVMPQRLYEFFVVSNPTSVDRYCIMCNVAKNFEALLDSIARRCYRYKYSKDQQRPKGIYEKTELYDFKDFRDTLNSATDLERLPRGSYQRVLKILNAVRNTDSHGIWYVDSKATDNLTEEQRNVNKILDFAALYVFTYAKYGMCI